MKNIKPLVMKIPFLGPLSIGIYRKIFRPNNIPYWLEKYLPQGEATVVQVGSNDGKSNDPVHFFLKQRKKWKAVLVEPVPQNFKRLKENYGSDPRITFENVAINNGEKQTFYSVSKKAKEKYPDLPNSWHQLGSFDRENIIRHLDGKLEPFIEETILQGVTLPQLLEKNSVGSVDFLVIDTEGYDWKVLSQLPLDRFKPLIILIEYKHLKKEEKSETIAFLEEAYHNFDFGVDLLSIRKDVIPNSELEKVGKRRINNREEL